MPYEYLNNETTSANTKDIADGSITPLKLATTVNTDFDWTESVKTANFTAVAGKGYFVNTTSSAITVTLPSSPSAGDKIAVMDYAGTSDTNNITINPAGSDKLEGQTTYDLIISGERTGLELVYKDGTQGWLVTKLQGQIKHLKLLLVLIIQMHFLHSVKDYKVLLQVHHLF